MQIFQILLKYRKNFVSKYLYKSNSSRYVALRRQLRNPLPFYLYSRFVFSVTVVYHRSVRIVSHG